jgi:hypothetical protein
VYSNTFVITNRQIEQAEKPTPAVVITMNAVHVNNTILHDYLTLNVALEWPDIGCTVPNIPIDNNFRDDIGD